MCAHASKEAPKETQLDRKIDAVFGAARKSVSAIRYAGLISPVEGVRSEGAFHSFIDRVNSYCTDSEKKLIRDHLRKAGQGDAANLIKNK